MLNFTIDNNTDKPKMRTFTADQYIGEAPPALHLIENFLVYKSTTALVADRGIGKTWTVLELALRSAAGRQVRNNRLMGFSILEKTLAIVLTFADSQKEIDRRLNIIDANGSLRKAAGPNFLVMAKQDIAGLKLVEKNAEGNLCPSKAWTSIISGIKEYHQVIQNISGKRYPLLVIIDTFLDTYHVCENYVDGVKEWFHSAELLKQLNATLVVTNYFSDLDPRVKIKTPFYMSSAVLGSKAFLDNVKPCYGIWKMPNSTTLKKINGKSGKRLRLLNMGILKNNIGINWMHISLPNYIDQVITIKSNDYGQLVYDKNVNQKRIKLITTQKEKARQNYKLYLSKYAKRKRYQKRY